MDVKVSGVQVIQIEILTNLQNDTCYDKLYIFTGGVEKNPMICWGYHYGGEIDV